QGHVRRWPKGLLKAGSIGVAMHAGVAALLPCAQHASPPRALAIFILELSEVIFLGQRRGMTEGSPAYQSSPLSRRRCTEVCKWLISTSMEGLTRSMSIPTPPSC